MDGLSGGRESKAFSGVRTLRRGFLQEVQCELGHKGWKEFWRGGWKKGRYSGCGDMVKMEAWTQAVLVNAAVIQFPVCAKSTAVNPNEAVYYFYFYHHCPPPPFPMGKQKLREVM